MSTNYYLKTPNVSSNDYPHVGLFAGCMFRFQAHPEQRLFSFADWAARLRQPDAVLLDEYDKVVNVEDFLAMAVRWRDEVRKDTRRREYHNAPQVEPGVTHLPGTRYRDAEGHLFFDFNFS